MPHIRRNSRDLSGQTTVFRRRCRHNRYDRRILTAGTPSATEPVASWISSSRSCDRLANGFTIVGLNFVEAPSLGMIAVTKLQTALTSLIAVIPALLLSYFLVTAMLFNSESLTTMAYLVLGGTLIASLVTMAIPGVILYQGRQKPQTAKVAVAQSSKNSEDIEAIDDDVEVSDSSHGSSGSFDAHDVLQESSAEMDIGDSDQDMLESVSEEDIETEPLEDFDEFDLEEEEEEKPKPKKKKR